MGFRIGEIRVSGADSREEKPCLLPIPIAKAPASSFPAWTLALLTSLPTSRQSQRVFLLQVFPPSIALQHPRIESVPAPIPWL